MRHSLEEVVFEEEDQHKMDDPIQNIGYRTSKPYTYCMIDD